MTINKHEVHKIAVEYVIGQLKVHQIEANICPKKGIDLILKNGETILVRSCSKEENANSIPLTKSINNLKIDYIIIATNLDSINERSIYIMSINTAINISINRLHKNNNKDNYFMLKIDYQQYQDNYNIFKKISVTDKLNIIQIILNN